MTLDDLYDDYDALLQRYAYSLTRDPDRVDDLVQETFIRSMNHLTLLAMLQPPQRRAWLKRTLYHLFIDEERTHKRQERLLQQFTVAEEISEQEIFAHLLTPNPFQSIAAEHRELFEMRYILGMNSSEIGAALGIPAATVRSRLHFATQKLRTYRSNWE